MQDQYIEEIDVIFISETLKAVAVKIDEEKEGIWLPKSKVEIGGVRKKGSIIKIRAPQWLLEEKGLV